ncbi:hypothetical protein F4782DRAFT_475850 [Xylaria castorea]|nr:hypothetical protein F4782DRAFT_475850 [Xylaria castorea]
MVPKPLRVVGLVVISSELLIVRNTTGTPTCVLSRARYHSSFSYTSWYISSWDVRRLGIVQEIEGFQPQTSRPI